MVSICKHASNQLFSDATKGKLIIRRHVCCALASFLQQGKWMEQIGELFGQKSTKLVWVAAFIDLGLIVKVQVRPHRRCRSVVEARTSREEIWRVNPKLTWGAHLSLGRCALQCFLKIE